MKPGDSLLYPLVPVLSYMNIVKLFKLYFPQIHFNIIFPLHSAPLKTFLGFMTKKI